MRMLIKKRGSGKTIGLIYASEATGFRIITPTDSMAKYIKTQAEKLGCVIPEPMQYNKYIEMKGIHDKGVLLDEVKYILDDILDVFFGCHVYAGTLSDDLKDERSSYYMSHPTSHTEYKEMVEKILGEHTK